MGVSYQTNWDTCQYLDYPSTPSFCLPDLIDLELQQALSLDHYNFPSIDTIFDTSFENYRSYPYLYPYQTLNESKPFVSNGSHVDFSTRVENLSCLSSSQGLVDFSTRVENLSCLTSSQAFVDFSTRVENLCCLSSSEALVDFSTRVENLSSSEGLVDFSADPEKMPCLYDGHVDFPTNVRKRSCPSDGFVDFSTRAEKLPRLSDGFVDFSTRVEKLACQTDGFVDFSTSVEKLARQTDGFVDFSTRDEKLIRQTDGFVDFSTHDEELPCFSEGFVDYSYDVEKLHRLSDGFVDFSTGTGADRLLPGFQCPPVFGGGGTLSAQSVAARQRRRKITERTHELGKLVPGGNKMNTAEMFGAAYDYIKYLQAQLGILRLLDSTQGNEDGQVLHNEDLEKLASSSKVQEKLYSHRKCLVPKHLVQSLANDEELKNSSPVIVKEIQQLIQKSG